MRLRLRLLLSLLLRRYHLRDLLKQRQGVPLLDLCSRSADTGRHGQLALRQIEMAVALASKPRMARRTLGKSNTVCLTGQVSNASGGEGRTVASLIGIDKAC